MGKKRNRWDYESEEEKEESEEEIDEEEDENEEEDEDVIEQIRLEAYESLLPQVKELLGNGKPNLQLDVSEKICLVCPTIQKFMGWKALMAHAKTIRNKRVHRHRGFHRALEEVILPNAVPIKKRDARNVRMKFTVAEEKKLVRPPVVVVENATTADEVSRFVTAKLGKEKVDKVVQVKPGVTLVIFRQEGGAIQAQYLVKELEDVKNFGRLRGHTAELKDMEALDPEKKIVDWSVETNMLKGVDDVKRAKEKCEEIQETVHKERQRLYKLEQSIEACTSSRTVLAQQTSEIQKELLFQVEETEKMKQTYEAERERVEWNWDRSLKDLELEQERKHLQLMASLRFGTKKTQKEKVLYLRRVELLQKSLESGSLEEKETSQKVLALMAEKEAFELEVKEYDEAIKSKYRSLEMAMVDEEEKEINELLKKYELEKNVCLEGWLADDTALNLNLNQELECNICTEEFDKVKRPRAIFTPCGHASTCVPCATLQRECPLCRQPILKYVALLVERIY